MVPYRSGQVLRVEFWKYPEQRLHYWWEAQVLEVREEGLLTLLPLGSWFHHESRGRQIHLEHEGRVAFFPGRWYSGGPDLDDKGEVLEYYWNLQTPPVFEASRIWQYDLELDLRAKADHTAQVFDEAEFAAKRSLYPKVWVRSVYAALNEIKERMERSLWPVLPPAPPRPWMER